MLRRVVETCISGVSWLVQDGKYAAISPAYKAVFGDLTGRTVSESHPPECAKRYMEYDRRAWAGETVAAIEETPVGSCMVTVVRVGDYLWGFAAPFSFSAHSSKSLAKIA